jgi:DNA-binding MarR family transcriptional regulator
MSTEAGTERIEALLIVLLSYAHAESTELAGDKARTSKIYKLLSRSGIKGSEIADIFGVSQATVSKRLNG